MTPPPRPETAVAEVPEESARERVFRISTELFARNGYHATGVQEISTATGLGRGALYYHIKSKEDLLYQISLSLLQPMVDRAREVAASETPPSEQIRLLARELLRNLAEHRAGWTVSLYESRALPPERREEVLAGRREYEQIWGDILERGHAEGSLQEVNSLKRRGILGLLNSTYLWIEAGGSLTPEQIADEYVDLLMDGLRPR